MEAKPVEIELVFETAMPVSDKADKFDLRDYRDCSYRNIRLPVTVEVDEELITSGEVRMPKRTKGLIGESDIYISNRVYEAGTLKIHAQSNTARELVNVDFCGVGDDLIRVTISVPPPICEVWHTVPMPVRAGKERFANNLMSIQFTNEAYLHSRERRESGQPPTQNARPQFLDPYAVKRQMFPDQEGAAPDAAKYPIMQFAALYIQCYEHFNASQDFQRLCLARIAGELDAYLNENTELQDAALYLDGLHEDLIQLIADGELEVYLIPSFHVESFQDVKARIMSDKNGEPSSRHLFEMRRFPIYRLLEIQSKKQFLEKILRGFKAMTDQAKDVFGLTGFEIQDGDKTTTTVTALVFGSVESLYRTEIATVDGRRRKRIVYKNDEPVLNQQKGKLFIVPWRVVRPMLTAFFEFYTSGGFSQFVHRNGLLIGENGFIEEKARERRQQKKPKTAKKRSEPPVPEAESDDAPPAADSAPPKSELEPDSRLPEPETDDGAGGAVPDGISFDRELTNDPGEPIDLFGDPDGASGG